MRTPAENEVIAERVIGAYEEKLRHDDYSGVRQLLLAENMTYWGFYRVLKRRPDLKKRYDETKLDTDQAIIEKSNRLTLMSDEQLKAQGEDYRQAQQLIHYGRMRATSALFHGRETPITETHLDVRHQEIRHDASDKLVQSLAAFGAIANRLAPPAPVAELTEGEVEGEVLAVIDLDTGEEVKEVA